jgi:hypothetical protein
MRANDGAKPEARVCRNENCVRAPEPDESYCATCGLELSLFVRDLRPRRSAEEARRTREAPRA